MRLNAEWRRILRKAWSLRLILLAGILTGLEAAVQFFGSGWLPGPEWVRLVLIMIVMGGAFIARLIAQKGMD